MSSGSRSTRSMQVEYCSASMAHGAVFSEGRVSSRAWLDLLPKTGAIPRQSPSEIRNDNLECELPCCECARHGGASQSNEVAQHG